MHGPKILIVDTSCDADEDRIEEKPRHFGGIGLNI